MSQYNLLTTLKKNISLTRREACQVVGMLGLSFSAFGTLCQNAFAKSVKISRGKTAMNLPPPVLDGNTSLEKAIKQRRTIRSFADKPLTLQQFSQILWAAQGITEDGGFKRAAPSAGALYPVDVYAVVGNNGVEDLDSGVYHYDPSSHSIKRTAHGDKRKDVAIASLRQAWMATAPVLFVVTAQYSRITVKYDDRGIRYAMIEAGHVGQNILLQCQTLGLAAGIVGAFYDSKVAKAINAPRDHEPLIIMPAGWKG